jgi:hypothetical protein
MEEDIHEMIMEEIILSLKGIIPDEKYKNLVWVFSKLTGRKMDY